MRQLTLPVILTIFGGIFASCAIKTEPYAAPPVHIIAFGDSITFGVPAVKESETFASLLRNQLRAANVAVDVANAGVGGENTTQALERLKTDVIDKKPDVVVIMYGANDSYVHSGKKEPSISPKEYRANLIKMVDELRRAGIRPILMTTSPYGEGSVPNGLGDHPDKWLKPYIQICRDVAKEMSVPLVDHYEIWTKAATMGAKIEDRQFDQVHLNTRGHEEMAKAILPVISRVLRND